MMRSFISRTALLAILSGGGTLAGAFGPTDWPGWRGPTHNGRAAPNQNVPIHWSVSGGVRWKVSIPGRGHGSPTIVGQRVFLPTADPAKGSQSVLCLDRETGKELWATVVHASGAEPGKHANSSAASSTVAWDGERLFINFLNRGAVYTSALSPAGKLLWQQKVSNFLVHQGFASSPVIHGDLVLVSADSWAGGAVAGLDRKTGSIAWSRPRPKIANYTTPAVLQAGGRTQMIVAGCNLVSSFNPVSGENFWEVSGSTEECVATPVTDGERVFVSGGYPRNHTAALLADGSGRIAWENNTRVYVPSMIARDGHLYAVTDAGMAVCWKSDSGKELWKERLGGDFFASPVMVGDRIYASNVSGKTYVYDARPDGFKLLAQNQLGDEQYASPVICGDSIYLRVATHQDGGREEFLYCIGR